MSATDDRSADLKAKIPLKVPSLDELASYLESGLSRSFAEVSVAALDCPDLTLAPFHLAANGLCGDVRIAEVGGIANLFPVTHKEKKFNLRSIAETCQLPSAFVLGPAAGPWSVVGCNCEMVANCSFSEPESEIIQSKIAKIVNGSYKQENLESTQFSLMANLLVSRGWPGKVLRVEVKRRIAPTNFTNSIRSVLVEKYGKNCVSLAGVFLMKSGKAKLHVMPNFPVNQQLSDEREVNKWLKFFEMSAPLVCATVMHSCDPGYSLRLEHTHCFSDHGDAGHYHYDTTANEVAYEGYFVPAEYIYRIDQVSINKKKSDETNGQQAVVNGMITAKNNVRSETTSVCDKVKGQTVSSDQQTDSEKVKEKTVALNANKIKTNQIVTSQQQELVGKQSLQKRVGKLEVINGRKSGSINGPSAGKGGGSSSLEKSKQPVDSLKNGQKSGKPKLEGRVRKEKKTTIAEHLERALITANVDSSKQPDNGSTDQSVDKNGSIDQSVDKNGSTDQSVNKNGSTDQSDSTTHISLLLTESNKSNESQVSNGLPKSASSSSADDTKSSPESSAPIQPQQQVTAKPSVCNSVQSTSSFVQLTIEDIPAETMLHILSFLSYDQTAKLRILSRYFDHTCGERLKSGYRQLVNEADARLNQVRKEMPRRDADRQESSLQPVYAALTSFQCFVLNPVDAISAAMDEHICCFPYGLLLDSAFRFIQNVDTVIYSREGASCEQVNWKEAADMSRMAGDHYKTLMAPALEQPLADAFRVKAAHRLHNFDSWMVETTVNQLERAASVARDDFNWEMDQLRAQQQQLKKENRDLRQELNKVESRVDMLEHKFKTIGRLLQ